MLNRIDERIARAVHGALHGAQAKILYFSRPMCLGMRSNKTLSQFPFCPKAVRGGESVIRAIAARRLILETFTN